MAAIARVVALDTLQRVHAGRADLASALELGRTRLADERDQALAAEIAIGTLRWRAALDHAIEWAGNRKIGAFDADVLDILRLSAYQLLHLDRVPAAAVVNDGVGLTRQRGRASAAGAVNAILRRISRDRSRLPMPAASDPLAYLSVTWSHPAWLVTRWLDRYGFDAALEWVRLNNAAAPVTLRANTLVTSRDALAERLERPGVRTRACAYAPDGLVVESGRPFAASISGTGQFLAQDEASQLVGAFAAPPPGSRVADACAAPGGKTAQLAAAIGDRGLLVAGDLRSRRIRLLRQTLAAARITVGSRGLPRSARRTPVRPCIRLRLCRCAVLEPGHHPARSRHPMVETRRRSHGARRPSAPDARRGRARRPDGRDARVRHLLQ